MKVVPTFQPNILVLWDLENLATIDLSRWSDVLALNLALVSIQQRDASGHKDYAEFTSELIDYKARGWIV